MKRRFRYSLSAIVFALCGAARGADLSLKAMEGAPGGNWTGFYVGGHVGYATGTSHWSATGNGPAPSPVNGSLDLTRPFDAFDGSGSQFGGFAAGYNRELPSRFVVGVEADISFRSEERRVGKEC